MTLVSFATFNCTTKYTLLDWQRHQIVVEHWLAKVEVDDQQRHADTVTSSPRCQ
jgi:hypothetical protein